jgi:Domain of unknown function (DUF6456)
MTTAGDANTHGRDEKAVLVFLQSAAKITRSAKHGYLCLRSGGEKFDAPLAVLSGLAVAGLIVRNAQQVVLSPAGLELAAQLRQRPGLELRERPAADSDMPKMVLTNGDESPLVSLQRGARTGGKPFLSQSEFDAGERIRSDFTRAMLLPRTSANWTASETSGRRAGESNGVETLTNSALAARQRFDAALASLGRDLSGAVADICCFLKGFEQVEMERKWPKRSAKFMLKAGLAVLALHYWPPAQPSQKMRRWGAPDYRPEINSGG